MVTNGAVGADTFRRAFFLANDMNSSRIHRLRGLFMKKAFITGVTGQDGSYLAEFLLEKGYEVHGMARRTSTQNYARLENVIHNPHFHLVSGDLMDEHSITNALAEIKPHEIY